MKAFISHSQANQDVIRQIVDLLKVHIEVWVYYEELIEGEDWTRHIERAIEVECDLLIVFLSKEAKDSEWVRREIKYAQGNEKPVFPVLLPGSKPKESVPIELISMQYHKLVEPITEIVIAAMARAVMRSLTPPPEAARPTASRAQAASAAPAQTAHVGTSQTPLSDAPDELPDTALAEESSEIDTAADAPNTNADDAANLMPYRLMLLLRVVLDQAVRVASTAQGGVWRAALLWFHEDDCYIAAESGGYSEEELTMRLRRGQGFAGQIWEQQLNAPYYHDEPQEFTPEQLAEDYKLSAEQAQITLKMGTILSFPIFDNRRAPGTMSGILSLDSTARLEELPPQDVLDEIRSYAITIEEVVDFTPMPYQSLRALQNILRVTRLLPPLDAPTRAGLYWADYAAGSLYRIVASEHAITEYSTSSGLLDMGDPRIQNDLRLRALRDRAIKSATTPTGYRTVALPIPSPDASAPPLGVLELGSSQGEIDTRFHRATLSDLARVAGKVLVNRHRYWND